MSPLIEKFHWTHDCTAKDYISQAPLHVNGFWPVGCQQLLSYGLKRQEDGDPSRLSLPGVEMSWTSVCPPYTVRWKCCVVNGEATS